MIKLLPPDWRAMVLAKHPTAQFTLEDGSGKTYGEPGEWTAHVGQDMQADVVGVYVPGDFCFVWDLETRTQTEFDAM